MIEVAAQQELEICNGSLLLGQREMSTIYGSTECSGWTASIRLGTVPVTRPPAAECWSSP
jgi:hypothetical protein